MTLRTMRRALGVATAMLVAATLGAQRAPERPTLPRNLDANDWEAYFDYGFKILQEQPTKARAAFYWSARLAPDRAEPLFWQWMAFHLEDIGRFARYVKDEKGVLERPDVRYADSLRFRALARNPFVSQGAIAVLYNNLSGQWGEDPATKGWLALSAADFARAASKFGEAIARDPEKYRWLRYQRAVALVPLGQFGAAYAQLDTLRESLRREHDRRLVRTYESLEFIEYAIGLLAAARGDQRLAREQMGRALAENLSFGPAHVQLAGMAAMSRDTAAAFREFALAIELDPTDAPTRHQFGRALLAAGRASDALEQLRAAVATEPYYADAHEALGEAYEALGKTTDAVRAYEQAVALGAAKSASRAKATARLAAIRVG